MKIFLCWSGDRSRACARAMKQCLVDLNQALGLEGAARFEPFHSDDIDKGAAWFRAVSLELAQADAAVLVLTPENAGSAWMHFEAGAVVSQMLRHESSAGPDAPPERLFTYLFGFAQGERPSGPLSAYQATEATYEDSRAMVRSLLRVAGAPDALPVRPGSEADAFETAWRGFATQLHAIRAVPITAVCAGLDRVVAAKTFREPLAECHRQEWLRRLARCRDTRLQLEAHLPDVEQRCTEYEAELFRQLVAALDSYEMAMDSHLVREERFPTDDAGRLTLPPGVEAVCERRRRQVLDATAVLLDPARAPVFHEAARFASLETAAERKNAIHRTSSAFRELMAETARMQGGQRGEGPPPAPPDWRKDAPFPDRAQLARAEASEWAFDRVMFYFAHRECRRWACDERTATSLGLHAGRDLDDRVCQWIEEEVQRITTSTNPDVTSRMPLSYALSIVEERTGELSGELVERLRRILADVLRVEGNLPRSEVAARAASLLRLVEPGRAVEGAADVHVTGASRS